MGFTFAGLFLGVLIQATILRLCLQLIAKHEADTSFTKALMVVAGASIGQIFVFLLISRVHPLAALPAVFFFTAIVIMIFCWISFWKSVLVVLIYILFQIMLAFLLALVLGTAALLSILGVQTDKNEPGTPYRSPMQEQQEQMHEAQQEAIRLRHKAMQKQAEIKRKMMEAEYGEPPPPARPAPQPTRQPRPRVTPPQQKPPEAPPVVEEPISSTPDPEWKAAKENLKIGGTMKSGSQYLALINGRMVGPGDVVRAEYRGRTFRWRIRTVSQDNIEMDQIDAR